MKTTVTTHERILRLVTSAVLIGLSTVLSLIKPIQMPLGGSITLLSMLPVCLLSVKYGVKTGLGCAFAYALLQLALDFGSVMSWGLTRKALVACIVIDYLLAFTSLGVAGVFRRKGQAGRHFERTCGPGFLPGLRLSERRLPINRPSGVRGWGLSSQGPPGPPSP